MTTGQGTRTRHPFPHRGAEVPSREIERYLPIEEADGVVGGLGTGTLVIYEDDKRRRRKKKLPFGFRAPEDKE